MVPVIGQQYQIRRVDNRIVLPEDQAVARASTSDQKNALDGQRGSLTAYAIADRWTIIMTAAEVGSGLNGHCPKLMKLLADLEVEAFVAGHPDRPMPFGPEYAESAQYTYGKKPVVADTLSCTGDDGSACVVLLKALWRLRPGRRKKGDWN
jgi:predicted site-specific integrase-resolvase